MSVGLASEIDLSISTLADLRNDLELINLELDATLAEKGTLAATVRLELLGILGLGEVALRSVFVEACTAIFTGGDVAEEIEVVVEEV